tara:strand:+ start:47 stop:271 length:225 start_codon:yes stop_codon:yes gene_type:complete
MEENYFINVLKVLDASIERGTWKGPEIEGVANLRKITLQAIKNLAEASQQKKEVEEVEEVEEVVESITKKTGEK